MNHRIPQRSEHFFAYYYYRVDGKIAKIDSLQICALLPN